MGIALGYSYAQPVAMNRPTVAVLVLAIAALLAIPTAAVSVGQDEVGPVTLSPHSGPNGQYATVTGGELKIDFDKLNDRATTTADNVATIKLGGDEPANVWVRVRAGDGVTAYGGDDPTNDISGQSDATRLSPGDRLDIGFRFDTHKSVSSGTVTVHAEPVRSNGGGSNGDGGTDPTDSQTPPVTPQPPQLSVSLTAPNSTDQPDGVNVTTRETFPVEGSGETRAVINVTRGLQLREDRVVTRVGQPVRLSGHPSLIGTNRGVDSQRRTAGIVDIAVPSEWQNRRTTLQFRIDRDRLGTTDPANARVGRLTDDGWQLLPTRVVESNDESVVLSAETPGFSTFAVFTNVEVTYEWTLPDGTTLTGERIRPQFDQPGVYNVTLTVTDAMGRSDTSLRQVIVNDDPSITIETPANASAGEPVTLSANVTNEVGNETVTWRLPDGTTKQGHNITHTFPSGEWAVRATVEDEFGENDSDRATVAVGGPGGSDGGGAPEPSVAVAPLSLPLVGRIAVVSVAVVIAGLLIQQSVTWERPEAITTLLERLNGLLTGRAPRITTVENPTWDPTQGRIEIEELQVDAPSDLLERVEITVTDSEGNVIVTKTIDVGLKPTYRASPERIWIPGDVDVSASESYSLRIHAVDAHQNEGALSQPTVQFRSEAA